MNGNIIVESTPDIGSVFSVLLPESKNAIPRGVVGKLQDENMQTPWSSDIKGTILYIEDSKANIFLMEEIFSTQDADLIVARNGEQGLELADTWKPGLIIIDINLPDVNGNELIKKIKTLEGMHSVPTIALSSAAMTHDIEKGIRSGFDKYITKPFSINFLLATIDELTKHAG